MGKIHLITEKWHDWNPMTMKWDKEIQRDIYYPVKKAIIFEMAKSLSPEKIDMNTPDKCNIYIAPTKKSVNIFSACASLSDIYHVDFHSDYKAFLAYFKSYEVYVTPDSSTKNVLLVSQEKRVIIKLVSTAPNCYIYTFNSFFSSPMKYEKKYYLYDNHRIPKLPEFIQKYVLS